MKFLLLLSFFFSLLNAAITLKTVTFDDYEENASTYLISYYPYQDFVNLGISSINSNYILLCRDNLTPSLTCISNSLTSVDLMRIREQSHLIEWNIYTDEFGLTLHETNFLYGFSGLLVGFGFYFGFILILSRRS